MASARPPDPDPLADHPALAGILPLGMLVALDEVGRLSETERMDLAREWGQVIAEHGDDLMYRSKRKGATASAFTGFIRGLAACAFAPGGVTWAGRHWCVGSGHQGTYGEAPCQAEIEREKAMESGQKNAR